MPVKKEDCCSVGREMERRWSGGLVFADGDGGLYFVRFEVRGGLAVFDRIEKLEYRNGRVGQNDGPPSHAPKNLGR